MLTVADVTSGDQEYGIRTDTLPKENFKVKDFIFNLSAPRKRHKMVDGEEHVVGGEPGMGPRRESTEVRSFPRS